MDHSLYSQHGREFLIVSKKSRVKVLYSDSGMSRNRDPCTVFLVNKPSPPSYMLNAVICYIAIGTLVLFSFLRHIPYYFELICLFELKLVFRLFELN